MSTKPTAIIADDEPLLRAGLKRELQQLWPELQIVAEARNGREAVTSFAQHQPSVCFLDVQMPGQSGLQAARNIRSQPQGDQAHLVFVTAYSHYAVDAFAQGVLDYLVKPVSRERLAQCVERLQQRLAQSAPPEVSDELLLELANKLSQRKSDTSVNWIRARSGNRLHLISVNDIDYARADSKYTKIAWREPTGERREALVRTALKDLATQLPEDRFAQVHRSVIVNLSAIQHVQRGDNETAEIHLRDREETLPVSRAYLHLFQT